jgi:hypothetical protein
VAIPGEGQLFRDMSSRSIATKRIVRSRYRSFFVADTTAAELDHRRALGIVGRRKYHPAPVIIENKFDRLVGENAGHCRVTPLTTSRVTFRTMTVGYTAHQHASRNPRGGSADQASVSSSQSKMRAKASRLAPTWR